MPIPPLRDIKSDEVARLYLWESALREAGLLLALASRAWAAKDMPEVKDRDAEYLQAMHAHIRARPDYEPGTQKLSHIRDYQQANPRPLGDALDYFGYYNACRMLAVVFFCQLFKSGFEEETSVARNSPSFVTRHMNELLSQADFSAEESREFDELRDRLETARDKMLAHADGGAFEFRDNPAGFQYKLHIAALDGIDFGLLATTVKRLQDALQIYLRQTAT